MIVSNLPRYKAFCGVKLGKVSYNGKLSVDVQRPRPKTGASSELSHGQNKVTHSQAEMVFLVRHDCRRTCSRRRCILYRYSQIANGSQPCRRSRMASHPEASCMHLFEGEETIVNPSAP